MLFFKLYVRILLKHFFQPMKTFQVSELNSLIKQILEPQFFNIEVKGEITNYKEQSSGHLYFSLKDEQSQISAVMFKGSQRDLRRKPKPGDQVTVVGELSVYSPRGAYQIVVRKLEYSGIGDLLTKLHELKEELKQKGYFDPARKKALPAHPLRIGIVTSPTGAVIQDILHIMKRRYSRFQILINPVKVQGNEAAPEIAKAIHEFNEWNNVDLIIVCRGGGSLEDLWPFNERIVVEALYNSKIPTISAVGHETDFSLSDFVADLRAPTPSAAAELIGKESSQLVEQISAIQSSLKKHLTHLIHSHKLQLSRFIKHPLLASPISFLQPKWQIIDEIQQQLGEKITSLLERSFLKTHHSQKMLERSHPLSKIQNYQKSLTDLKKQLDPCLKQILQRKRKNYTDLIHHLQSINPKNLLQKGYCICFHENTKSVIMSKNEAENAGPFSLLFHDGETKVESQQKGLVS